MNGTWKFLSTAVAASAALAGALSIAAPAQAEAYNDWGSGSYHAGYDGVATSTYYGMRGYACSGGAATKWYVQMVRTSDGTKIASSVSYPADGGLKSDPMRSGMQVGTAYYIRWYGQNNSQSNGYSAPCSGAGWGN